MTDEHARMLANLQAMSSEFLGMAEVSEETKAMLTEIAATPDQLVEAAEAMLTEADHAVYDQRVADGEDPLDVLMDMLPDERE